MLYFLTLMTVAAEMLLKKVVYECGMRSHHLKRRLRNFLIKRFNKQGSKSIWINNNLPYKRTTFISR